MNDQMNEDNLYFVILNFVTEKISCLTRNGSLNDRLVEKGNGVPIFVNLLIVLDPLNLNVFITKSSAIDVKKN